MISGDGNDINNASYRLSKIAFRNTPAKDRKEFQTSIETEAKKNEGKVDRVINLLNEIDTVLYVISDTLQQEQPIIGGGPGEDEEEPPHPNVTIRKKKKKKKKKVLNPFSGEREDDLASPDNFTGEGYKEYKKKAGPFIEEDDTSFDTPPQDPVRDSDFEDIDNEEDTLSSLSSPSYDNSVGVEVSYRNTFKYSTAHTLFIRLNELVNRLKLETKEINKYINYSPPTDVEELYKNADKVNNRFLEFDRMVEEEMYRTLLTPEMDKLFIQIENKMTKIVTLIQSALGGYSYVMSGAGFSGGCSSCSMDGGGQSVYEIFRASDKKRFF